MFGAAVINLRIGRLPDSGLLAYVIDAPFLYEREGNPYIGPDGHDSGATITAAGLRCLAGLLRIWPPVSWIPLAAGCCPCA